MFRLCTNTAVVVGYGGQSDVVHYHGEEGHSDDVSEGSEIRNIYFL